MRRRIGPGRRDVRGGARRQQPRFGSLLGFPEGEGDDDDDGVLAFQLPVDPGGQKRCPLRP